jgi:ABC-2 type transport system permease protein
VTPIFWSPQQLNGPLAAFEQYNILYHYVAIVRDPLLGQAPTLGNWLMVMLATVLGWGVMLLLYGRIRRRIPIGCNIFPGANAGDFPMEYVSP